MIDQIVFFLQYFLHTSENNSNFVAVFIKVLLK